MQIHELDDTQYKKYLDICGKLLLEKAIGETFELKDKPDLQGAKIGVELTKIIFDGAANSVVRKLFGRGNSFSENCALADEMKGGKQILKEKWLTSANNGEGTVFSKNCLISPLPLIANSIKERVKEKLAKLNSGQYKIFNENFLLIKNMEFCLVEDEYKKILSKIIQEGKIHFDKIFVSDNINLYEYDYRKQKFAKYSIEEWASIKTLALEELRKY